MKFSVGDKVYVYNVDLCAAAGIRSFEGKIGTISEITSEIYPYVCKFEGLEFPHDQAGFFERELALLLANTKINRKLYPDAKLVDGYLMVRSEDV